MAVAAARARRAGVRRAHVRSSPRLDEGPSRCAHACPRKAIAAATVAAKKHRKKAIICRKHCCAFLASQRVGTDLRSGLIKQGSQENPDMERKMVSKIASFATLAAPALVVTGAAVAGGGGAEFDVAGRPRSVALARRSGGRPRHRHCPAVDHGGGRRHRHGDRRFLWAGHPHRHHLGRGCVLGAGPRHTSGRETGPVVRVGACFFFEKAKVKGGLSLCFR